MSLTRGAFVVRILKLLSKVIAKVNYLTGMLIRDCTDQVKTMRGHTQFPGSGLGIDRPGLSESEIGLMEGTTVSFCKSVSWQFAVGFGERVLNM